MKNGPMISPVHLGKKVKLFGRTPPVGDGESDHTPSSTKFLVAMMTSISISWNRSTMSAQRSWNKFSFSNFLKTVDLISTNCTDRSSVMSALE